MIDKFIFFNSINEHYEYDYEWTKQHEQYHYGLKYQDYHTGIYNIIEFDDIEYILIILKYIINNDLDLDDDQDRYDVQDVMEYSEIESDTYEINFRFIYEGEDGIFTDSDKNTMILVETDYDFYQKEYDDFLKNKKIQEFNI